MDLVISIVLSEKIDYILYYKKEKIGYATVNTNHEITGCYIEYISINSKYQKQGFGSILIRKILHDYNHLPIYLIADPLPGGFNDLAILLKFYTSLGFIVIKEFKTVIGSPQVLMMWKKAKL